jgi:aryl-alcohol dehydrogenase-like predicted oxidoreductase
MAEKIIEKIPFGATGHLSSRIIFGAATLGGMSQAKADSTLELVQTYGINHIDVAASYGEAELRLADFLKDNRSQVFLATKTGDRSGKDARASIERSLARMQTDHLDLIQFHNLAQDKDWEIAMGPCGALEAAVQAKEEGLVKNIGITGHGTRIAEMHLKSLGHFDFASVLLPYSYMSMQDEQYSREFESLYELCQKKQIAMQTIKAIARRRWRPESDDKKFSWYEPLRDTAAITNAVHWVLSRPGIFLNSTSDATLLKTVFDAAASFFDGADTSNIDQRVAADAAANDLEPLFFRGELDDVQGPNGLSR